MFIMIGLALCFGVMGVTTCQSKNSALSDRGQGDGVRGAVTVLAHVIDVEPYSLYKDIEAT